MKRLLLPFLALALTAPAKAAPIHLTCVNQDQASAKQITMQIFVDTDRGVGSIDGMSEPLTVRPNELQLAHVKQSPRLSIKKMVINRTTLAFTYHRVFRSQYGSELIKWDSSGQCSITPAKAGRQI